MIGKVGVVVVFGSVSNVVMMQHALILIFLMILLVFQLIVVLVIFFLVVIVFLVVFLVFVVMTSASVMKTVDINSFLNKDLYIAIFFYYYIYISCLNKNFDLS
jgi:hypothetical protein